MNKKEITNEILEKLTKSQNTTELPSLPLLYCKQKQSFGISMKTFSKMKNIGLDELKSVIQNLPVTFIEKDEGFYKKEGKTFKINTDIIFLKDNSDIINYVKENPEQAMELLTDTPLKDLLLSIVSDAHIKAMKKTAEDESDETIGDQIDSVFDNLLQDKTDKIKMQGHTYNDEDAVEETLIDQKLANIFMDSVGNSQKGSQQKKQIPPQDVESTIVIQPGQKKTTLPDFEKTIEIRPDTPKTPTQDVESTIIMKPGQKKTVDDVEKTIEMRPGTTPPDMDVKETIKISPEQPEPEMDKTQEMLEKELKKIDDTKEIPPKEKDVEETLAIPPEKEKRAFGDVEINPVDTAIIPAIQDVPVPKPDRIKETKPDTFTPSPTFPKKKEKFQPAFTPEKKSVKDKSKTKKAKKEKKKKTPAKRDAHKYKTKKKFPGFLMVIIFIIIAIIVSAIYYFKYYKKTETPKVFVPRQSEKKTPVDTDKKSEDAVKETKTPDKQPEKEDVKPEPEKVTPVEVTRYAVQLGSYTKLAGAEEEIQELKSQGIDAEIVEGYSEKLGTIYRVRAKIFDNMDEAEKYIEELKSKGWSDVYISAFKEKVSE